ncbi:MAG: rod shape-determining protein MreD [Pseudomonadota bacterium]
MTLLDYLNPVRALRMAQMGTLGLLAIYGEAAPLGLSPSASPSPDLLLCIVCYWSARRPDATPLLAVFLLGLARDLVTDMPVGAGALALVIVSEGIKTWRHQLARAGFFAEWLAAALAAFVATALPWLLVLITLAQPPYLTDVGNQILHTIAAYPIVMLLMRWVLRVSWKKAKAV